MSDRDERTIFSLNGENSGLERFGIFDDFPATENRQADFIPGLVGLGYLKEAVLRSARLWGVTAVVGLLIGLVVYVGSPHQYQASATVFLTHGPYEDSLTAPANNQAIATTRAVAGLALHELGLQQTVSSFLSTYTVTSNTDRVLTITSSAPSADQAVRRATATATAFLNFRASSMRAVQNLTAQSLNQQIKVAKQNVSSIGARINQLSGQATSSTQQSQLSNLRAEQINARDTLSNVQQALTEDQTTTLPSLTAALKGSEILTVAPLSHSRLKSLILYGAIGLLGGLFLGLTIVVLRALITDKLRRRDDISYALDAPVKLSVGTLRARRWLPGLPGRAARQDRDMRRLIAHLQSAIPRTSHRPVGLAIVAVDNAPDIARAVMGLATSCVSKGNQVLVADLSKNAPMANLLGAKNPGVHTVNCDGANFTLAVPDRDDAPPIGPLRAVNAPAGLALAGDALVTSDTSADILLTLVTLDPALGGDHLATWATSGVVVVTAGQSSAERLHAVGEIVRLAGMRLDSVVLARADKGDETLGLTPRPDELTSLGMPGPVRG